MSRSLALAALAALTVPAPALAFKCTRASPSLTSPTQVWMSRCIPYYISTSGTNLDDDARILLVQQSFAVWSGEACTDLVFEYRGKTTETEAFSTDTPSENLNVIASIEDDATPFGDPNLIALTLTRFSVATGEILDADILLNGVRFRFDDVSDMNACRNGDRSFDLRNTLVHEMGHFIGFDHTDVPDATMQPTANPCETLKRDLAEDDRMAICVTYPKGGPTMTCTPPESYTPSNAIDPMPFRNQCDRATVDPGDPGGCSCASATPGTFGAWALLLCSWGLARRRRAAA